MTKPLLQLAAIGVVGIAVWKLALPFFVPLIMLIVKIALIAGLVMAAIWWINKQGKKEPPPDVST